MNKVLVICGPTGTGKTDLSLSLANEFNGEIISADSRQIYKNLNIGTGKDLPSNSKFEYSNPLSAGFYEVGNQKIWGYDLLNPNAKANVSEYQEKMNKVLTDILDRNKMPIIVGGTGLYIKSLIDGIETAHILPDENLRKELQNKTAAQLFEVLFRIDPAKADSMNQSDRHNSRRLTRAIEIATSGFKSSFPKTSKFNTLFIGLTAPQDFIEKRIEKRVQKRIKQGALEEVKQLLINGIKWTDQSMSSIGYKEWQEYLEGNAVLEDVVKIWIQNEVKYVKRQLVWFKKDKRVNWFDVSTSDYAENVEKMVKKWYAS